jgi:hypothetical protein
LACESGLARLESGPEGTSRSKQSRSKECEKGDGKEGRRGDLGLKVRERETLMAEGRMSFEGSDVSGSGRNFGGG